MIRTSKNTLVFLLIILTGCAGTRLKLKDWTKLPDESCAIPPYARYLAQYKIALDPGHGGDGNMDDYKRGPTGKREAVMNLNVARFLTEFLELAGAQVILTRKDDSFVALQDRVDIAEKSNCDFMLSLHHNASQNPATNYTAVFYHLTPDYSPFSMDLARNIYFGLVDALRLPQVVDDGLLTDRIIYPAGFGLLRRAKIPAVVLESSFYSNKKEEKRLMNLKYNRREAYGIFLGLARWAAGGVPKAERNLPAAISKDKKPLLEYRLYDGITERGGRDLQEQLIYLHSVTAEINDKKVPVNISPDKKTVTFAPDTALTNGYHTVKLNFQNMFKNHNSPRVDTLIIASPTDSMHFLYPTVYLPADNAALMPIRIAFLDKDRQPVWDGTEVRLKVNRGEITPLKTRLKNGQTSAYFKSDNRMGLIYLTATADAFSDTLFLSLVPKGHSWVLSGVVLDDSTQTPIAQANVSLNNSIKTVTDENGVYFFLNPPTGADTLRVEKNGYEKIIQQIEIDSTESKLNNIGLNAYFDGLLHDQVIILDAAQDDSLNRGYFPDSLAIAEAGIQAVNQLAQLLHWAGAKPVVIQETADTLTVQGRIQKINQAPDGWYLKLRYQRWELDSVAVQATIYPANKTGEKIAGFALSSFARIANAGGILLQNTNVPEVTYTNKTAVEIVIKCREANVILRDVPALLRGIVEFYRDEALVEKERANENSEK